jgi:hypothetical protein
MIRQFLPISRVIDEPVPSCTNTWACAKHCAGIQAQTPCDSLPSPHWWIGTAGERETLTQSSAQKTSLEPEAPGQRFQPIRARSGAQPAHCRGSCLPWRQTPQMKHGWPKRKSRMPRYAFRPVMPSSNGQRVRTRQPPDAPRSICSEPPCC